MYFPVCEVDVKGSIKRIAASVLRAPVGTVFLIKTSHSFSPLL